MSLPDGPLADLRTLNSYNEPLKKPRPFLVPAEDDQVIEILPAEKENRKIKFQEDILVTEIEDRFFLYGEEMEEEEEEAYEIEIVEDDGDADFYLEIVDGEVFYVFETEDDISEDSLDDMLDDDGGASVASSFESSMHSGTSDLGFDFADLKAPNLDDGDINTAGDDPGGKIEEVPFPEEIKLSKADDDTASDANPNDFMLDFEDDSVDGENAAPHENEAVPQVVIPEDAKNDIEKRQSKKEERHKAKHSKKPSDPSDASEASASSSSTSTAQKRAEPQTDLALEGSDASLTHENLLSQTEAPNDGPKAPPQRQPSMDLDDVVPSHPAEASPPTSPGGRGGGAASVASGSQVPHSPSSRGRSILKANAPSPRAETKRITSKKEGTDKKNKKPTFTKTYVRAEQFDGEHRVYSWQKPAWTQGDQLAPSEEGEKVRKGGNLAGPITHVNKSKDEDASGTGASTPQPGSPTKGGEVDKEEILRRFVSGEIGSGLMTNSLYGRHQRKLKVSVNGAKLREGGDIVKPITKATVIRTPNDINHVANPGVLRAAPKMDKKTYQWEKPEWAQGPKLRSTSAGAALKEGADLQAPITQRIRADAEAATAANRRLRNAREDSGKALDAASSHSWKQPSWASSEGGVNGLRKVSSHSSEHSRNSNGSGSQLGEMRASLRKTPSSSSNKAETEEPEPQRPQLRNSNDAEAERRRRQELLARVAKSWG